VGIAVRLGITKIRLTGGEPLVRKGAVDFAGRLGKIQEIQSLTITTNGILLPKYAVSLREAGVHYINISLDTLNEEKFYNITHFNQLDTVLRGIRAAKDAGFKVVKVNVVSVRGFNEDELFDFVEFADEYELAVRFIEYMPFCGNEWQQQGFIPSWELKKRLEDLYELIPLSDDPFAAARTYRIAGHKGSIGFISPVSESFCRSCNRLRLTSDGYLRPCLHREIEVDLKGPLRNGASDDELAKLFLEAVYRKPISHQDFLDHQYHNPLHDREMVRIGG
jgi:cyclic pyranopterin phosphate synthase